MREHFEWPTDYVLGKPPIRDDQSGRLLNPANNRRAWTWEIRIHGDHPIDSGLLGIWMSEDYYEGVRSSEVRAGAPTPGGDLLDSKKVTCKKAADLHRAAEEVVAQWL